MWMERGQNVHDILEGSVYRIIVHNLHRGFKKPRVLSKIRRKHQNSESIEDKGRDSGSK